MNDKPDRRHRVNCDIIQSMLLDHLEGKLDPVRSDMVWKHLKKCADCQKESREMENTLAVLRQASIPPSGTPERLSEKHRASLLRALTHPVLDWMERYHVAASLAVAILIVMAIVCYLRGTGKRVEKLEKPASSIDVNIVYPPPPTNHERIAK